MNGDGKCSPEHLPHGHRDANGTFGLEAIHALVCNKRLCSIRNYVFIVMACCKRQVKLSQCQYNHIYSTNYWTQRWAFDTCQSGTYVAVGPTRSVKTEAILSSPINNIVALPGPSVAKVHNLLEKDKWALLRIQLTWKAQFWGDDLLQSVPVVWKTPFKCGTPNSISWTE